MVPVPAASTQLYHHLTQLEAAKLIEIAEYRPLAGGKVERVYAPTATEPLGDNASPADVALMLGAALEAARAHPDDDGVGTTLLWTAVDREDRSAGQGQARGKPSQAQGAQGKESPTSVRRSSTTAALMD